MAGQATGDMAAAPRAAGRPLVLVVDDDEAVRALLETALSSMGCTVRTASNGRQALELLDLLARTRRRRGPDVILLDLEMPVLDGGGFVTRYRARPGSTAAIVVISGSPDAREVAARLGAVDVVTKPFDLDVLLERVARWVRPGGSEGTNAAA